MSNMDIVKALKDNDVVWRAGYDKGLKAGVAKCRPIIRGLCDALHDLAPDEGQDRVDAEELIADAKALLDGDAQ